MINDNGEIIRGETENSIRFRSAILDLPISLEERLAAFNILTVVLDEAYYMARAHARGDYTFGEVRE